MSDSEEHSVTPTDSLAGGELGLADSRPGPTEPTGGKGEAEEFRAVVIRLHREKDHAYGPAWKRRGEVLGVLANIATKVDRIEVALANGAELRDESLVDTAVDLFVYALKYETLLADLDRGVAQVLFGQATEDGSFSDGPAGFENLLRRRALDGLIEGNGDLTAAAQEVLARFGDIEHSLDSLTLSALPLARLSQVHALTDAALALLGALRSEASTSFRAFLDTYARGRS